MRQGIKRLVFWSNNMPNDTGFLSSLTSPQMLSMTGTGLLNLMHGRSPFASNGISDQTNALLKLFGNQTEQAQPIAGTNPGYQLPSNNPIANTGDTLSRLVNAIGSFESGNKYSSLGPLTKGDRAYGRYQVMGRNIPQWTKEVLGRSLSPQEFLADQAAQDAVAQAKLGAYLSKYGNVNDAASAWFSGRPMRGNTSKDVLGTSVPSYVAGVNRYL